MWNKDMDKINEFMIDNGFELVCKEDECHFVYSKVVEGLPFIYLLIAPHSGTKNRFLLHADVEELHDRWSNCEFQRFFKDVNDFKQNWGKYLISDKIAMKI